MKPIKLTFSAFGPYANQNEIDFNLFQKSKLFLIWGQTGSGKTAILDAMTYALYAESTSGNRGKLEAMRCQSAKDETPTIVEFTFEAAGLIYRFKRGFSIKRKKDGSFSNSKQLSIQLFKEGEGFIPILDKISESQMTEHATKIIGLNCEQFKQVIILPQGKFESLLVANNEEKEKILLTLFDVEKWSITARNLGDKTKLLKAEIESGKKECIALLSSIECEAIDKGKEKLKEYKELIEESRKNAAAIALKLKEENQLLIEMNELNKDFIRKNQLEAQKIMLENSKKAIDEKKMLISLIEKAQNIEQTYMQYITFKKLLHDSQVKLSNASENQQKAKQENQNAKKSLDEILLEKDEHNVRESEIARLNALNSVYFEHEQISKKLENEEKEEKKLLELFDKLKNSTENFKSIINAFKLEKADLEEKSSMLSKLAIEHEALKLLNNEFLEIAPLSAEIEKAIADLNKHNEDQNIAKQSIEAAKNNAAEIRMLYHENISAALYDSLAEGMPCPVCGSKDHPIPAKSQNNIGKKDLDTAEKKLLSAQEKLNSISLKIASSNLRLASSKEILEQKVIKIKNANFSTDLLKQSQIAFKNAKNAKERLSLLEKQLSQENLNYENSKSLLDEMSSKIAASKALVEYMKNSLLEQKSKMDSKISSLHMLEAKQSELIELSKKYDAELTKANKQYEESSLKMEKSEAIFSTVESQYKLAEQDYRERKSCYDESLKANEFEDEGAFLEAISKKEKAADIRKEIQNHEIDLHRNSAELCAMEKLLTGKETPDIKEKQWQIEALEKAHSKSNERCGALEQNISNFERVIAAASKIEQALNALESDYAQKSKFVQAITNTGGVSLSRYILGVMIDALCYEANKLLRLVHDGRYQLFRTYDKIGKEKLTGLNFEVMDSHSGKLRTVQTLSGGEKFLASLSLSLGLSSIVQAQLGAVKIDALFIDEGFGSLDTQSIADALDILGSIKGGDRLVGIISHVNALKENISACIEVEKGKNWSILKINS